MESFVSIEMHKNRIESSKKFNKSYIRGTAHKRLILKIFSVQKLSLIEFVMKVYFLISFFCMFVRGNTLGLSRRNLIHETFSEPLGPFITVTEPQRRSCAFDELEKSMEKFLMLEQYIKFSKKCFKSVKSFHFLRFLSRQKC